MRFKPGFTYIILQLFVGLTFAQDIHTGKSIKTDSISSFSSDSIFSGLNEKNIFRPDSVNLPETTDVFIPNSTKAVWYSAVFPGLGQIYNRKYWKLPIIYGGFIGIAYGLAFNQRNYTDYSIAYRDAVDSDPMTKSYEDFISPSAGWSMNQIQQALKRKKDYYRRYRDLSIIGLVAMYVACMIDAYVDAELYTFDISPDLSFHVKPAVINNTAYTGNSFSNGSALGLQCRINF